MNTVRKDHRPAGLRHGLRAALVASVAALAMPAAAQVSEGTELNWGVVMEIATIDPAFATNNWESTIATNVYDTLVYPDGAGSVKPWMADSWEISDDGLTYTFTLKPDLLFHDGTTVEAQDVAWSMERMIELGAPAASYFAAVDPSLTEVIDASTIAFTLKEAYSPFLKALLNFRIVNKDLVMENLEDGDFGENGDYGLAFVRGNDAGSGPYRVTDFPTSDSVSLGAFEDYTLTEFIENAPTTVNFSTTPEMATIASKLRAGEIDIADWGLSASIQDRLAEEPGFTRVKQPSATAWYVVMNTSRAPLDDVDIRKAVALSYDTDTVTTHILGGGGPLAGPVPGQVLGECEGIATYDFDLDAARELVAQSGYTAEELEERPLEIAAVAGSERFKNIALLLSTNLRKAGIPAEVVPQRWADIVQAATTPESAYDLVVVYDSARVPDPTVFLTYYTPDGHGRAFPPGGIYWEDPEVTDLVNHGLASTDPEVQRQDYCEASRIIAEASPAIFSHTDMRQTSFWDYITASYPENGGAAFYDLRFENWAMDPESETYQANH
ncbi:ABC transporter substrate-binding protein [Salipiger mucosus]|uniref:Solute-binding protein family 5 domain-containing protein n=1 Tax=Salipiger mucosus DSM 16094 TaxID=1123237 RepID=S9QKN4_9RHOB|nr:ABC transporter substrate-binding protein [Salipiger mucosus]EPX80357.1 hypothetical protein Salmuc_03673 [Salipiger mucosus DSM 16094]